MPERVPSIPVRLDRGTISARLRFGLSGPALLDAEAFIARAQSLIKLRSAFEVSFVGAKGRETVEVAGITFSSSVLRNKLDGANKVFPYIITVGPELERTAAEEGDLLRQYYLEEIANLALEQAANWLTNYLEERFGVGDLSSLSPGSLDDWPITEQTKLFSIFGNTERLIGVRLTDSLLMVPRKSISGILFPSEEGFVACQLCARERCPRRKAPLQPINQDGAN
jgi:hypothetical protein